MIEVEWTDVKCKGCNLPLRKTKDETRCANTNCPGDPAPTPDSPARVMVALRFRDSLLELDKMLEQANESFVKAVLNRE